MKETLLNVIVEKRKHKVYITRNTEYHLRDNVCVGVRNRRTGDWILVTAAIGATLVGGLHQTPQKEVTFADYPWVMVGDSLLFLSLRGTDVLTTKVEQVQRPCKEVLRFYLAKAA